MNRPKTALSVVALALALSSTAHAEAERTTPYRDVLALKPLGVWPADEGQGEVLHDRSGNGNDARIFHVPWKDGLLDFTPAYQWAQVPGKEGLLDKAFSMGGWVFNRSPYYDGGGALFMSFQKPTRSWFTPNVFLRIRKGSVIEVTVDNARDSVGSLAAGDALAVDRWQHVFFTCGDGAAKLYINGVLAQAKEGVSCGYTNANVLQMAGCGKDWGVYPSRVESFHGSLCAMALFDRVLGEREVVALLAATRPIRTPKRFSPGALVLNGAYINDNQPPPEGFTAGPVVFDGEEVTLGTLASKPLSFRYRLLKALARPRGHRQIKPTVDWLPDFSSALNDWQTRWPASKLLMAIGHERATAGLTEALPRWIETLGDTDAVRDERAACALAMGEMGKHARAAIPTLAAVLDEQVAKHGTRIPRVEDVLRNAAIYALLRIDTRDKQAEAALTAALAKPVVDSLDLSKPFYATVKPLAEAGKYMQALEALRKARPGRQVGEQYFSQGDRFRDERERGPHTRAYTPKAEHLGVTYALGSGISPHVAEPITEEDFQKAVQSLAAEYPQAATWRKPDAPNLYRLKISKTYADGRTESTYLVGDDFVFDGTDGKIRGWSIAIDKDGYLHLIGGQHNYPSTKNFISGSFLRMGLSEGTRRNGKFPPTDPRGYDPKYPAHMYWVSRKPGDITSFEFVGSYDSPRKITRAECVNYMNFVQDNDGVLYCYFRTVSVGFHSLGLHRYHTGTRRWSPVGGDPFNLIKTAEQENPAWRKLLVRAIRNGVPKGPDFEALTWAWQPHFYNYMRSTWGVQFDRTNRMHVEMEMRGLIDGARILDSSVYAYSDDGGKTFHRADGSNVKLPLTNNPVRDYNADIAVSHVGAYWGLWKSVLRAAGYL